MALASLAARVTADVADFKRGFAEINNSVNLFGKEFEGITAKAAAFGRTFGLALGAGAVVAGLKTLAASVLENAGNIEDLSQRTGLAIRTIQEFQHAADQTGTTLEAFTNAAFKLGTNLAGGSKSVVAGVTALGLSFRDLQALSPDEQFNQIAVALGQMENPQERNRIALELFGRAAKEILPAIAQHYDTLKNRAVVASDGQIKALSAAGDAWDKFLRETTTHATAAAGSLVLAVQGLTDAGFVKLFQDTISKGSPTAAALDIVATKFVDVELAARKSAGGNKDVTKSLTDLIAETDRTTEAQKKAQRATEAHAAAVKQLADKLSGAGLVRDVKELSDAFKSLGDARRTPVVIQNTADAALELFQAGAKLTPELFNIVIEAGRLGDLLPKVTVGMGDFAGVGIDVTREINAANQAVIDFNETMNSIKFTKGIGDLANIGERIGELAIPEPLPPTFWDSLLDVKGPSLAQSARFAADNVIGSLGEAIRTGNWAGFKAQLRDSFSQFAGSAIAAGVNLLVPGLGTLLQPIFAGLASAFTGLFDRNKGRDLVESFADSLGGFDALQKQLGELGAEGDRLWKALTQGVGRNNPDQAAKAIAEVQAALAKFKQEQQAANITTEEGAQATIESAAQAAVALDQLNERLLTNSAAWGDWSTLVTGYLQNLADDIRALPLPGPTGTMGGSTGGARPRVSIGGSSGGGSVSVPVGSMPSPSGGGGTAVIEIDGRLMAEVVVPEIPGVVQRYGLAGV